MVFIITALYHEARAFIASYQLKPVRNIRAFRVFQDEDASMILVVSGAGKAAAAAAIGCICTFYDVSEEDFLVNIGTAARLAAGHEYKADELFICNKITEVSSGKTYYPDMLLDTGLKEASVFTADHVVQPEHQGMLPEMIHPEPNTVVLADMEASAVWEAGMLFLAPHRILIVKAVSDPGDGRSVSAEDINRIMTSGMPAFDALIQAVRQMQEMLPKGTVRDGDDDRLFAGLEADLHCSETMRIRLQQLIRYARLEEIDFQKITDALYQAGTLPCRDRREGKKALEQIRNSLL